MKLHCLFLLFIVSSGFAQGQIVASDSLSAYINKEVSVCERVASVFVSKSNVVFLNFGKPYPNQTFVGVIFAKSLLSFPYDPAVTLKDKFICVKGKVKMYKGTPEIIIFSPTQIKSPQEVLGE